MSEAVSALSGASSSGFVSVVEAGLRGMIILRGDLGAAKLKNAVKKLTGVDVPEAGRIAMKSERGVAWMSPDEVLILTPYVEVAAAAAELQKALKGTHHLVANVSDTRAVFRLQGKAVREVLAKISPADVSVAGFAPGQIRRSRLAQVAGAFWLTDEETAEIVCFRSVAAYVFGVLQHSARAGSEVGYP